MALNPKLPKQQHHAFMELVRFVNGQQQQYSVQAQQNSGEYTISRQRFPIDPIRV